MTLNKTEEIIAAIAHGEMVVLMDDEDRENEGDLIMAASLVRPEDINFMAKYGRGLICLTLTRERCKQLRLPLMVSGTDEAHATNFTLSIEATKGVTTGISAADRATTVLAAVANDAKPEDIEQPGHIFPLMAQPGGVLTRAGHTEAGCDLARLANLVPASVIVEILNDDGTMARRPELEIFAREHGLKIGTVADLIQYRIEHESSIEAVAKMDLPTEHGDFRMVAYLDKIDDVIHYALVKGEINKQHPTLVRVHMYDPLMDVVKATKGGGFSLSLSAAMQAVQSSGSGVVVILHQNQNGQDIIRRIRDFHLDVDTGVSAQAKGVNELRTYGIGAQILADLGVGKMRILGSKVKLHGLQGFGLEVVE